MVWTALQMLMGERTKFLGIVFGVTFASLLMSQQMSIFCGIMRLITNQIRLINGIDVWVMDADVRSIDDLKPLAETALNRVRGVPGVRWAVPYYKGVAQLRLTVAPDEAGRRRKSPGRRTSGRTVLQPVMVLGLDDLALFDPLRSDQLLHGTRAALRQPDAIFIDKYSCEQLWPEEKSELKTPADYQRFLGRSCELNDHRAVVVGICRTSANFVTLPVVYTTFTKVRQFMPMMPRLAPFVLVKAEKGVDPRRLCHSIEERTDLKAISADEFTWTTIWYYVSRTGIPLNFGITVVLGFLIGTAIAGQTFYQFTIENLRQFGALKAMGTSDRTILGMILLQSFIVAPIGYSLGVGFAALFGYMTRDNPAIAFFMPWQVLALTALAVMTICVSSSLFSIRRVMVLEPAIVFRG